MKDLRDPSALGTKLLESAACARQAYGGMPLSEVWDEHVQHLPHPDHDHNPSPVEKYGDPVKTHQARIALGMEVELP